MNIIYFKIKVGHRWSKDLRVIETNRTAEQVQARVQALTGCKTIARQVGRVL